MGFVSQTSAAVCSNMRAASCFDLLWSRRHHRLSHPGTLWWRVVTAAAAAAEQQDVLDAKAGGSTSFWLMFFAKSVDRLGLIRSPCAAWSAIL
ncbi:MAG: hypothetical protein ISQ87_10975 [Rhodobacteraceae bacterium]|nr:hypothetical protein [Paracoccaceae bacterium]MBL6860490.1 hypothetical protein [Paracoccaceae bacterium]